MGSADQGIAPGELLCERTPRCDGRGFIGRLRGIFRNNWGPGIRVGKRRWELGSDCAGSTGGTFGGSADAAVSRVRIELPYHLRTLAQVPGELELPVAGAVTQRSILDALEAKYPVLQGTIRDHGTYKRRPFLRFFACSEDWSH